MCLCVRVYAPSQNISSTLVYYVCRAQCPISSTSNQFVLYLLIYYVGRNKYNSPERESVQKLGWCKTNVFFAIKNKGH